jgi:hypothetical protein
MGPFCGPMLKRIALLTRLGHDELRAQSLGSRSRIHTRTMDKSEQHKNSTRRAQGQHKRAYLIHFFRAYTGEQPTPSEYVGGSRGGWMTNDILYTALESPLALSQPIIGTSNQILHQKYLLSSASSIHLLLHISLHFSTWEDCPTLEISG